MIEAYVLVGGRSRRLKDKLLLEICGQMLLTWTLNRLHEVFDKVQLVGSNPKIKHLFSSRYDIHEDMVSGVGPLGGIYTALKVCESEHIFIVAGDMPLVSPRLLKYFMETPYREYDIVLAKLTSGHQRGYQPLCAIYSKSCIYAIEALINTFNGPPVIRLIDKLNHLALAEDRLRQIEPDLLSFFNVNTKEDLNFLHKVLL